MSLPLVIPLNPAVDRASVRDGRARWREILHAVNAAHGSTLPDARPADGILKCLDDEPKGAGDTVNLGTLTGVRVVIVPGFLSECIAFVADILTDARAHLGHLGASCTVARVDGRGGAAHNARQIRDHIMALPDAQNGQPTIVIAMSKGCADTLEMLAAYPQTHARIDAVVSLVGCVCGSPLAGAVPDWLRHVERMVSLPTCKRHGGAAQVSLHPKTRTAFLHTNPMPPGISYYSLGAVVDRAGMSKGMLSSFDALARLNALNDGQMLLGDQILPDSVFLGALDCDHIATAMPFNREGGALARFVTLRLLDQNAFPREVMAEALVRQVLEDLGAHDPI